MMHFPILSGCRKIISFGNKCEVLAVLAMASLLPTSGCGPGSPSLENKPIVDEAPIALEIEMTPRQQAPLIDPAIQAEIDAFLARQRAHLADAESAAGAAVEDEAARAKAKNANLSSEEQAQAQEFLFNAFELFQLGEFDAAQVGFDKGLRIAPANGIGQYYFAETLERLGDVEGARERYRLAIALLPSASKESLLAETRLSQLPSTEVPIVVPIDQTALPIFFRDCPSCPDMTAIPVGSLRMGSPEDEVDRSDNEGPQQLVTIAEPFAIGVHEVTRGQFAAFVSATGYDVGDSCYIWDDEWQLVEGRNWRSPGFSQSDDHPVVCVNWDAAQAYVGWLSGETGETYRLPSEAEWEYAARAGTPQRRFWGDDLDNTEGCTFANAADLTSKAELSDWTLMNCRDGFVYTAPVGRFAANDFGLHDPLGNVLEWVEDCWNSYAGAPTNGTAWTSGDCGTRLRRGGSWLFGPSYLRSAKRVGGDVVGRSFNSGFRVARTLGD